MHIRKVAAALFLAASPWLAAAAPAPAPAPAPGTFDKKWIPYFDPMFTYNASWMTPGEIECLHSTQAGTGTRWRIKWKGFCEDWEGQCLHARILNYAHITDNWQSWKTDEDGWWRADFTLLGF
jgi:hypothetical protein|uniref:Uncharacterized protein n=1 Tax=Bionectria ochroleuca TaxID=29856 RepID=A0A8H7N8A9_BIOOC